MSTPAAIAVYTEGSGIPRNVTDRPWRGVYHHWGGEPADLGKHLVERVRTAKGNMQSVVRFLIDEAPYGWSSCFEAKEHSFWSSFVRKLRGHDAQGAQDRYSADDPGLPVSPGDTGAVAFAYVFDLNDRRIDAFATYADAHGQLLGSIRFSGDGTPDLPAFDLLPEERVQEPPIPGPTLTPDALLAILASLPQLGREQLTLSWVNVSTDTSGSLLVCFRVIEWNDGTLANVVEREWNLVPKSAREEPERVRNGLQALAEVLKDRDPDPFWISSLDPFRRSEARTKVSFQTMFQALLAKAQSN